MKRIVYTNSEGGVAVVSPVIQHRWVRSLTFDDGRVIQHPQGIGPLDKLTRRWPLPGVNAEWAETEDEFVARIQFNDVPASATDIHVLDESTIPTERAYRNAWVVQSGQIIHDMTKAREIHKDHMRRARAPLLSALDEAYMRADEKGASGNVEKAAIIAQKQALRDMTADPRITAAQTVAELKQVWPAALGANPL